MTWKPYFASILKSLVYRQSQHQLIRRFLTLDRTAASASWETTSSWHVRSSEIPPCCPDTNRESKANVLVQSRINVVAHRSEAQDGTATIDSHYRTEMHQYCPLSRCITNVKWGPAQLHCIQRLSRQTVKTLSRKVLGKSTEMFGSRPALTGHCQVSR